jgi:DNA helicase-2/ATP-dependent DNA helicase PcrA
MQVGLPNISTPPKLTMLTFQPLEAFRPHSSSSLAQSSMISDQWTQPLHSSDSSASATTSPQTIGVKRRLGMGRSATGYSNKKFKPPA